jgi:predicted ester cyclase
MDKTDLADMFSAYTARGDDALIDAMAPDFYDNVSGQRGPTIWRIVRDWMEQSFAERSVEVHCATAEGDRVMIWLTVHATHVGSGFPWLQARPASGRRVAWKQVHIFRLTGDTIVEHWAVRDDLRVLEAIDAA